MPLEHIIVVAALPVSHQHLGAWLAQQQVNGHLVQVLRQERMASFTLRAHARLHEASLLSALIRKQREDTQHHSSLCHSAS